MVLINSIHGYSAPPPYLSLNFVPICVQRWSASSIAWVVRMMLRPCFTLSITSHAYQHKEKKEEDRARESNELHPQADQMQYCSSDNESSSHTYLPPADWIKSGVRFIENEDVRIAYACHCNRQLATHSPKERFWLCLLQGSYRFTEPTCVWNHLQ